MTKTALERAFELARAGGFQKIRELRRKLQEEGFSSSQIEGPALLQQLRDISKAARASRDAPAPESDDSDTTRG